MDIRLGLTFDDVLLYPAASEVRISATCRRGVTPALDRKSSMISCTLGLGAGRRISS